MMYKSILIWQLTTPQKIIIISLFSTDLSGKNLDLVDGLHVGIRSNVQQSVACTQIHNENKNRSKSKINCPLSSLLVITQLPSKHYIFIRDMIL